MPDVSIIYWRDIPAQVMVGSGRKATKTELPERFQVAIDAAAMKAGARDTDAYLTEWHKNSAGSREGDEASAVAEVVAEIDAEFDMARLRALIEAGGKAG